MTIEQLERDLWEAEVAVNALKANIEQYRAAQMQPKPSAQQVASKLAAIEILLADRGLEERVVGGSGPDRSYWTGLAVRYNAATNAIEIVEVAQDGDPECATVVTSWPFYTRYTEIRCWLSAHETEQLRSEVIY